MNKDHPNYIPVKEKAEEPSAAPPCSAMTQRMLDAAAFRFGGRYAACADRVFAVASENGDLSMTAAYNNVADALRELACFVPQNAPADERRPTPLDHP